MNNFKKPNSSLWQGRNTNANLYLHEKVICADAIKKESTKTFAILSYACDEGVKRNQGRVGAVTGPEAIIKQLAKMPNHLDNNTKLLDVGTVFCIDENMEHAQQTLAKTVTSLLKNNNFPIVLGGGHDIAYGHYNGILNAVEKDKTIGIINFDAHFDLRANTNGNNSGTPFYQIAEDCKANNTTFKYLCLGIRDDANDASLFKTAKELGVTVVKNEDFNLHQSKKIQEQISTFIQSVDVVYTTIDLDGFSSAYAAGVSAASPMGFSPNIALQCLQTIIKSGKLISLDIAEMNPEYDIDNQTAKLAASLVHTVIHNA
ncbi:formimidoylglutamase [Cellulophaga sp. 20_2_10]|uniref:formimidoylglutamase n=1 Tax=Cellulophaga sp. 20_2_10 TaxID=2942476 RepID=UPI00201ABCF8|nr:formimidoylglutamase [Cellulophaga sp. 20_2_10]MCL5247215.1 formimidoylglutamase [Cellulophaga sp. 20_2_10]